MLGLATLAMSRSRTTPANRGVCIPPVTRSTPLSFSFSHTAVINESLASSGLSQINVKLSVETVDFHRVGFKSRRKVVILINKVVFHSDYSAYLIVFRLAVTILFLEKSTHQQLQLSVSCGGKINQCRQV